jgi:multidrug transporter EmrE-like cation transporter
MLRHGEDASSLHPVGVAVVNNLAGIPLLSVATDVTRLPYVPLVLSCIAGVGIAFATPVVQRQTSATMFVILGVFAKVAVVSCGVVFFGERYDLLAVCGLVFSFVGAGLYTLNERNEKYNFVISPPAFARKMGTITLLFCAPAMLGGVVFAADSLVASDDHDFFERAMRPPLALLRTHSAAEAVNESQWALNESHLLRAEGSNSTLRT